MHYALVRSKKTGVIRKVDADEFARDYAGQPWIDKVELTSPYDGRPLNFRHGQKRREGGTKAPHPPHFAYKSGYGDPAHVFGLSLKENFTDAVQGGQKVLLNLNEDLSYRDLDFSGAAAHTAPSGESYEAWVRANYGQYKTLAVPSAEGAVKALRRVHDILGSGRAWESQVFANYRGGVLPYKSFFVSKKRYHGLPVKNRPGSVLPDLFNRLQGGAGVRLENGEARAIGLPHLVQFIPTKTMLSTRNPDFIRGMSIDKFDDAKSYMFSQLIFSADQDKRRTRDYQRLMEHILSNPKQGVYVLASPSITIRPPAEESRQKAKMIRWIINDIEAQTCPVGKVSLASPAPAAV